MRKWKLHLGQTPALLSRSRFQIIWRHPSHFCQRPSVRTLRSPSSPLPSLSSGSLSFLNQDIQGSTLTRRGIGGQACARPSARIGAASQGRETAVDLFCEHGARQLVWEGHRRKGEQQI